MVQGTLRTLLDEDRRPLKAASVVVRLRCYEAELSTTGTKKGKQKTHVLYEQVEEVWNKGSTEEGEWGALGDFVTPFRVVLPVDAGGVTTSTFKLFKTWWQLEAGMSSSIFYLGFRVASFDGHLEPFFFGFQFLVETLTIFLYHSQ